MELIDWIKELFLSQSWTSYPTEKEGMKIDDDEEEEIQE
jgi:hypothetical protein